jgi:predicted nucleotidyltransferase component of viral defense system
MIPKEEILARANEHGVAAVMIEKDYVLGWILNAISTHPSLKNSWVFKGGTCLKKCYFKNYRFSEDLDFTVLNQSYLDISLIQDAFNQIIKRVYEESGIEIDPSRTLFETVKNPVGQIIIQGRIFYKGPVSPLAPRQWPRIKFDLTQHEVLVFDPIFKPIFHPYTDIAEFVDARVQAYAMEELFIEKTRALYERTRPRDLFDVVEIWKREEQISSNMVSLIPGFHKKCNFKNVNIQRLSTTSVEKCRIGWKDQLGHQLAPLPDFDEYLDYFVKNIQLFFSSH